MVVPLAPIKPFQAHGPEAFPGRWDSGERTYRASGSRRRWEMFTSGLPSKLPLRLEFRGRAPKAPRAAMNRLLIRSIGAAGR